MFELFLLLLLAAAQEMKTILPFFELSTSFTEAAKSREDQAEFAAVSIVGRSQISNRNHLATVQTAEGEEGEEWRD